MIGQDPFVAQPLSGFEDHVRTDAIGTVSQQHADVVHFPVQCQQKDMNIRDIIIRAIFV